MAHDRLRRRGLPALVFLLAAVAVHSAILWHMSRTRRADVPVDRAISSSRSDRELVDSDAVDRFIVENLRATGIPGAAVAITHDGRIVHVAGYGHLAGGAAVTHSTPLPVASLTKSFTAAAVMRLVEQGKVELDQPVQRYLPEFALADPRASRITVAHLLAQTSGIAYSSLPARPSRAPHSLAEQIDWLRGATLAGDPGSEYSYCNENYDLLAAIVERMSGQPFERAMEETLFAPLGMRTSRVFMTLGEPLPGIASGHTLMFGVPVARELPSGMGSGGAGAVSSANDLARWLVFQTGGATVDGERLLSQQSIAAMHTPSFAGSDYGFGWLRAALPDGTTYVHHSGRFPNMAAHERLLPETGYAFAVVLNGIHPFNAEAASFIAGLTAIVTGREATVGPPFLVFGVPWGVVADSLLALFILLFVSIGVWGALRAGDWAKRFAGARPSRIALRLVPYAALTLVVAASPWLMSTVNRGQRVPFAIVFDQWPPLGILLVVAAAAGATVVAFRCARLLQAGGG